MRPLGMETLENRAMLTALGIVPEFPLIAYNSTGVTAYDAGAQTLDITASPLVMLEAPPGPTSPPRFILPARSFEMHMQVDNAGTLVGGVAGDDLTVTGSIDLDGDFIADVSGTLLTGEISEFGYEDNGTTDFMDFRFTPTGGAFLTGGALSGGGTWGPYYSGKDIAVTTTIENSTFDGTFTTDFSGGAKGNIGETDPLEQPANPAVDIEKFTRVDDAPVPPLDVEKLVRVDSPDNGGGTDPGTPPSDDPCAADHVVMTFSYSGTNELSNPQEGKATVTGDLSDPAPGTVYIVAATKNDDIYFAGEVDLDEQFDMVAADAGLSKFGASTFVTIYDAVGGNVLQEIQIHTSCSKPIHLGDIFGGVTLVGIENVDGGVFTLPGADPDPVPAPVNGYAPGINDDDADDPTGPTATVGDTVVWTYVVTNDGNAPIENVTVTDDNETLDTADDFNPDPVLDGGYNTGDTNQDGLLDPGEVWLYTAGMEITETTATGQHRNVAKAVGTYEGAMVMDDDPAHFINPELPPPSEGDLCAADHVVMSFTYTGTNELTNPQEGKSTVTGDLSDPAPGTVYIEAVTKNDDIYFAGEVDLNEEFDMVAADAGLSKFGASTFVTIYDAVGGNVLQEIQIHTSCSKPIHIGDIFGGVTLTGVENIDGNVFGGGSDVETDPPGDQLTPLFGQTIELTTDSPFNPLDIGVDADTPTGPIAELGDKITWTYVVTNTGDVNLTITDLTDDNETPGDTSDDFTPDEIIVDGFNYGDANMDGILNPGESWYFQAMEIATVGGQHTNIGKVKAVDDANTMVMDDDPSNHFINPLSLQKYTRAEEETVGITGMDLCADLGLDDLTVLTFTYQGGNTISNTQEGRAIVDGTLSDPAPSTVYIVGNKGDSEILFSGAVNLNETFDLSAAAAGLDKFGSNTYISIYSADPAAGGSLLQDITVHTSCSKPIALGDVFGGVTLIAAADATGDSASLPAPSNDVGDFGADADTPEDAVDIEIGETVIWTYAVTNTGSEAMENVVITDDAGTPGDTSDDFSTTDGAIVELTDENGFNLGDADLDGIFDGGETWLYEAIDMVRHEGLYCNEASVAVDLALSGTSLTAEDASCYNGTLPDIDLCETGEKAASLSMRYTGDNFLSNTQEGKASVTGTLTDPAPETVYVVATNKDNDIYFAGEVDLDEEFTMTAENAGESHFGASTFITIYDSVGGAVLQEIEMHTSCSKPLGLGDQFGGVQLVGFVGEGGTEIGIIPEVEFIAASAGDIVSEAPVFSKNKMMVTITNTGAGSAVINEMNFNWDSGNKKLKKIKSDRITIFDVDTSHTEAGISIGVGDWEASTLGARTLSAGESIVLKFEFERDAEKDASQYSLIMYFDLNGDGDSDDDDEALTIL